jgi:hypothetical protein
VSGFDPSASPLSCLPGCSRGDILEYREGSRRKKEKRETKKK